MQNYISGNKTHIYTLLIFLLVLLSCKCTNKSSTSGKGNTANEINENNFPPSWPWRGIAITSAKTNHDHISFRYLKSIHVNHVSLAYMPGAHAKNYKLDLKETIASDIQWLHQMLDSCKKYDITALITYQEFPHDRDAGFNQSTSKFWNDQNMLDSAMNTVKRIVSEFKDRGDELTAYEFFCEPVISDLSGPAIRPEVWPAFAQQIINEVQKIDQKRYLVINTGPWGNPSGYKNWEPLKGERLIYGTHMYQPHSFTSEKNPERSKDFKYPGRIQNKDWSKNELRDVLRYVHEFQINNRALIYVGEFSAAPWSNGNANYLSDCVEIFESYGFSYNYWNLNGWSIWNINYDTGFPNNPKGVGIVGHESSKWKVMRKAFLLNKSNK